MSSNKFKSNKIYKIDKWNEMRIEFVKNAIKDLTGLGVGFPLNFNSDEEKEKLRTIIREKYIKHLMRSYDREQLESGDKQQSESVDRLIDEILIYISISDEEESLILKQFKSDNSEIKVQETLTENAIIDNQHIKKHLIGNASVGRTVDNENLAKESLLKIICHDNNKYPQIKELETIRSGCICHWRLKNCYQLSEHTYNLGYQRGLMEAEEKFLRQIIKGIKFDYGHKIANAEKRTVFLENLDKIESFMLSLEHRDEIKRRKLYSKKDNVFDYIHKYAGPKLKKYISKNKTGRLFKCNLNERRKEKSYHNFIKSIYDIISNFS